MEKVGTMNNNTNNDIILIDYYEGAYGPTIRIDVQSIQSLSRLKMVFLDLSELKLQEYSMDAIESIHFTNIGSLILKVTDTNSINTRVRLIREDENNTMA